MMDPLLIIFLASLALFLTSMLFAAPSQASRAKSALVLGGNTQETRTTTETRTADQQAQAGTTAAPPPGGAAAAQQQARPAQATTTHTMTVQRSSSSSSDGFLPNWLGKAVFYGAVIFAIWKIVPVKTVYGNIRHLWKGSVGEPALPYHYAGPGEEDELTSYTTDAITRKGAVHEFQNGFMREPINGASLFKVNKRLIYSIWKPDDRIGDTLFFQCYEWKHECLGPSSSDHSDCTLFPLKNGRRHWVIGSEWDSDYVVEGTDVLHAWTNSTDGPVTIKFRTRKRSRTF